MNYFLPLAGSADSHSDGTGVAAAAAVAAVLCHPVIPCQQLMDQRNLPLSTGCGRETLWKVQLSSNAVSVGFQASACIAMMRIALSLAAAVQYPPPTCCRNESTAAAMLVLAGVTALIGPGNRAQDNNHKFPVDSAEGGGKRVRNVPEHPTVYFCGYKEA